MKYKDVRTKDGTVITDVPFDMDKNDPRIKARYEQIKAMGRPSGSFSGGPGPGTAAGSAPPPPIDPRAQGSGLAGEIGKGLGQGTAATVRGLAGGVANTVGTVVDPATAVINTILDAVGAPPEIRGQTLGSATKNLLDMLGVPQSETMASKIVESASRGLGEAATGIGAGGAVAGMAPALGASKMGAIGANIASGPVQQAMGGVGSEVASQVAGDMGASPGVQMAAGLAGGVAGSTIGNVANLRKPPPGPMQSIVDDSAKFKTQLMTSDVIPPKTFAGKALQAGAEKIPVVGTGPVRATQQANRISDVRDLLHQFSADDETIKASNDVMRDLLTKRKDNFARWEGLKKEALKSVEESKPGATVPMPKTIKSIDESIAYLKGLNNEKVGPAISELTNWKTAVQNQSPSNVLTNKQMLGDIFDAPEMSAVKKVMGSELKKTYDAVKNDLTDFVGEAGGAQAKNKWNIANAEESKLFKEVEGKILDRILEEGKVRPEVVKNMLFNKDRSVIESLNKNLTAKGRASARTAIMQEVGKKIGEDASPEKFITEIRKLKNGGDPVGVFFSGDDLKAVEGLTRVLKATSRASQASLSPPTGVQLVLPAATTGLATYFGGGVPGFIAALGTMGAAGGAARIYESKPVRDILMKLPKVAAKSAEETALFNRLFEVVKAQSNKEQQ
jgi:hypothetical protein